MGSNYVILEYTLKINNFCLASFKTFPPDSSDPPLIDPLERGFPFRLLGPILYPSVNP